MQKQTLLLLFCLISITLTLVSGSMDREEAVDENDGKSERALRQIQIKRRMRNDLLKKLAQHKMCGDGRWTPGGYYC